MKIAFFSNKPGQAGTSSNLLAITTMLSLKYQVQSAILQLQYKESNNLQVPLIGRNRESIYFSDIGMDALMRNVNAGIFERENIEDCCVSLLENQVHFIPETRKLNKGLYENDLKDILSPLLHTLNDFHDLVFIDVDANNPLCGQLFDEVDMIVANLGQNPMQIEHFMKEYEFKSKKMMYVIGRYDKNSYYNIKNISKTYHLDYKKMACIPYCTEYMDAMSNSEVIKFMYRNENCNREDINYDFIHQTEKAANKIIKISDV